MIVLCGLLGQPLPLAHGQSTLDVENHQSYAANAGWMDWRTSAEDGVRVAETLLSGYVYAANFGWINLGDGSPTNQHSYGNTAANDYGVNVAVDGALSGYAYAANIGWINFEQAFGKPRLDFRTGSFSGHAYAANIGWIALATNFSKLAATSVSRVDRDADGMPDAWELRQFGNLSTARATTDNDRDGQSDLAEYVAATAPRDAKSRIRITSNTVKPNRTEASLTFDISPSRWYRVETSTDHLSNWQMCPMGVFKPTAETNASITVLLPRLSVTESRFFRVAAIIPLPPAP